MKLTTFAPLLLLLFRAECRPPNPIGGDQRANDDTASPCAQVRASAVTALQTAPKDRPTVTAQLAYECLSSVPLNPQDATALINSLFPYIEWQSDLSYLKAPPPGYQMPAVDVIAELNRILVAIESGAYSNEYQFQMDLFLLFQSVHDGHFRFIPDLMGKTFQFRRKVSIVSVSIDGVETPKVYVSTDIAKFVNNNSSFTPFPVSHINGQNTSDFLNSLMMQTNLHDADAQYNMMMYGKAGDAHYPKSNYNGFFTLTGYLSYTYPGPLTTFRFENGTEKTYQNYATVKGNFENVTDGASMYKIFCTGTPENPAPSLDFTASTNIKNSTKPATRTIYKPESKKPAFGYPKPEYISSDQVVSGYFLNDTALQDVAVLSILSFQTASVIEFQSIIQKMILKSKLAGKTKLIIDLSSNGGGNLLCGYDTFRQLFPQIEQDGFTRIRSHDALQIISKQVSDRASNFSFGSKEASDYTYYQTPLNYRFDLNVNGSHFSSHEDKFGPIQLSNDNFTNIMRWEVDDPTLVSSIWGVGTNVTGYGDRKNFTQPFDASNIVLVYDGACASTCVIFSEFMRTQAGVRSIAFGGRPTKAPIQGIGGTKGANSYDFASIYSVAQLAQKTGTPTQVAMWKSLSALTDLPISRSIDSAVNIKDIILRENLEDGIPAQFLYEEANCRLFYEPSMIMDVQNLWNKAASAAWGDANCVSGHLNTKVKMSNQRLKKADYIKNRQSVRGTQRIRAISERLRRRGYFRKNTPSR